MKDIIIGIVGRKEKTIDRLPFYGDLIITDYMRVLDNEKVSYIGLVTNEKYDYIDDSVLKICDGFLFQGGNEMRDYHFKIIDYAYKNKKPVLGICLGCQIIGSYFNSAKTLKQIENHNPLLNNIEERSNPVHQVNFIKESKLYNLFGENALVNSRHKFLLDNIDAPLKISGISNKGDIEAVELENSDNFIVGVQWHPENMETMQPLFHEFIENVIKLKESKSI